MEETQHPFLSPPSMSSRAGLNLSLSTQARSPAGAYVPSPTGPFTGYASILGRSRFLRPAQELLDHFSTGNGVSFQKQGPRLLEDSGSLFADEDDDVASRCSNPNLVSMLHEVYKRYKLYFQQMQSAVTSFESVAGLGNAAPYVCYAVKAMSRHFHCLKNAILDHIRVTSKVFGRVDTVIARSTSVSFSGNKGHHSQKQVPGSGFLQHPVWRSQRGFPDKAVAVLRTWLFEHFLHPYPSDYDKQMLAQKTGLSRSQVSNWFTNARVRLWKPMVEEMHALERKTQCSKAAPDTPKFINLSTDHHTSLHSQLSEKDLQMMYMHTDQDSQCKRSRIEAFPREKQRNEQLGMLCNQVISQAEEHISHGSALDLGRNQENTAAFSWSTHGQIMPFWLAKQ